MECTKEESIFKDMDDICNIDPSMGGHGALCGTVRYEYCAVHAAGLNVSLPATLYAWTSSRRR